MHVSTTSRLRFLVFGAGAIGSYVGGSLALNGYDTVFLERPDVVNLVRQKGIRLNRTGHIEEVNNPIIAGSIEEALTMGPFDVGIFAVKSFDTTPALVNLAPYKVALPPLLCLQNGVENEGEIASVIGPDKVIAGSVTTAIGRPPSGEIVVERKRGIGIALGHSLTPALVAVLNSAGLNARAYSNAQAMKWSKMLTNLLANATSAILDLTPLEIYQDPRLCKVEIQQIREAIQVMRAMKLPVTNLPGVPVRSLAAGISLLPSSLASPLLVRAVGSGRGGKMPSFHIDLHSGRGKSEVDFLNGAVVRYGDLYHIPTPVNRALTDVLLKLTRRELAVKDFAKKPEVLLKEIEYAYRNK